MTGAQSRGDANAKSVRQPSGSTSWVTFQKGRSTYHTACGSEKCPCTTQRQDTVCAVETETGTTRAWLWYQPVATSVKGGDADIRHVMAAQSLYGKCREAEFYEFALAKSAAQDDTETPRSQSTQTMSHGRSTMTTVNSWQVMNSPCPGSNML